MLTKKADAGLTAVVIILIIIVFLGWLINIGQRECSNNNECKDGYYCGSDFACHKIPVIEKVTTPTIVQRDYTSLTGPFMILGLALIVSALILRYKRNKKTQKTEEIEEPKTEFIHTDEFKRRIAKKTKSKFFINNYMIIWGLIAVLCVAVLVSLIFLIFLVNL